MILSLRIREIYVYVDRNVDKIKKAPVETDA